jgi:hypothetical protein
MSADTVGNLLADIRSALPHTVGEAESLPPMVLHCHVSPPIAWDPTTIEHPLGVTLPRELRELWRAASEIRLLDDVNYGQWGCILWNPAEVVAKHQKAMSGRGEEDFRPGDLIIGEFRGDSDLVLLRCDSTCKDYGSVLIALPLDPRDEWPCVAISVVDFIRRFLACPGQKYWDVMA